MATNNIKYVILANSSVDFETPRQLTIINGETLVGRTIRLLKENNVKNILISSSDERFDNLGAERYEPLYNNYIPNKQGYWVDAFPYELLDEPICFLMGDVYYSENAIKTIVKTKTDSIMFFCAYQNHDRRYIKSHDEPLGFKVIDTAFFKYHINKIKKYKDSGEALREPIAWELYRSLNGQDLTKHVMTTNYVAINDESCDIDTLYDIINLRNVLGGNMIKLETTYEFTLGRFNELIHITRKNPEKNEKGRLFIGDTFECSKELADYLTGNNQDKIVVAKVIEVEPQWEKDGVPLSKEESEELDNKVEAMKEIAKEIIKKQKRTKKSKKQ